MSRKTLELAQVKYELSRAVETVVGERIFDDDIEFHERKTFHNPLTGILDLLNNSLANKHNFSLPSLLKSEDSYENNSQIDSITENLSDCTNNAKGVQTDNSIAKIQDIEHMYQIFQEELANTRKVVLLNQRKNFKQTIANSYSKVIEKTNAYQEMASLLLSQERTDCKKEKNAFLSDLKTNHEEYNANIISIQKKKYDIEKNLVNENLLKTKKEARAILEEFERVLFKCTNSITVMMNHSSSGISPKTFKPAKIKDVFPDYDSLNEVNKTKEILLIYEKRIANLTLEIEDLKYRQATIQANFNLEHAIESDVNQSEEMEQQEQEEDNIEKNAENNQTLQHERLALEVEANQKKMKDLIDAQEIVLESIRNIRKIDEANWFEFLLTRMKKITCLKKMKTLNSTKAIYDRQLRLLTNVAKCKESLSSNGTSTQT